MSNDITIINARLDKEDEKGLELHLNEEALRKEAIDARDLIISLQEELDQREDDLKDGLSFLDMKNDTLLSYMIDVCNIVLRKVRGDTIEDHPSVERCVTYRVILEKIKAIDQRLAYQLNRLITLPENADVAEEERVNVENLDVNLEDAEDSDDDHMHGRHSRGSAGASDEDSGGAADEEDDSDGIDSVSENSDIDSDAGSDEEVVQRKSVKERKTPKDRQKFKPKSVGVYKPPKLRSVAYTEEGDLSNGNKGRRKNYDEFYQDDATGDIVEDSNRDRSHVERIQFEEDNYTRLPEENPKKAKRKLKTKEYRRKGKKMRRR